MSHTELPVFILPFINGEGGGIGITLSVCPSVRLSFCQCVQVCLDAQPFLIRLGMVVYYYEVVCHAENMVLYLQRQGHSEGLQN